MTTVQKLTYLQDRFRHSAFVKDAQQGYVVAQEFNLSIDPHILELASECWADYYRQFLPLDAVVGLPDAGARLASGLAELLGAKHILPSKRTATIPGAWTDVVSYSNHSFTMGTADILSHIGFVQPGMRVLLVDDVVARGETAVAAIKALQAKGVIVVGLAVLFDKKWQGGVTRIELETSVKTFSLISIQKITDEGTIVV